MPVYRRPPKSKPREPRLGMRPEEAADLLSLSKDSFRRHVLPSIRVVKAGRLTLVPRSELERWLDEEASRKQVS